MIFILPLRVRCEANRRGHWALHSPRTAEQRLIARQATRIYWPVPPGCCCLQAVVTLTRIIGPRGQRMDDDGVVSACKAIRDGIADALGINDGSKAVEWRYGEQERGKAYGVRVEIKAR